MATRAQVLAWLDERGWPHDPRELTKEQDRELRNTLKICGHRTVERTPCAFPPMANGRCKKAGGTSLKGTAHPNYQGKGRGKYLRGALRDRYKEINAASLMDLTETLRIMAVRESMLFERMDPAETGRTWKALKQEWAGLQTALRAAQEATRQKKDPAEAQAQVQQHVMALTTLIGRGATDAESWEELQKLWEAMRRTVESEVKRRVLYRLFIKAEDATQDYDAMADAVKDTVDDFVRHGWLERKVADRLLAKTSDRFAVLVTLPGIPAPSK